MPRSLRVFALLAGLLLLAGLAAACGGDDEEAKPTATAVEEATETPEATEESGTPQAEYPFESFHYTVEIDFTISAPGEAEETAISGLIEGDFVAPDSHAFTSRFEFGGLSGTQEVVIIGDDAWIREGSGEWRATTLSDPDVQGALDLTSADPGFLQDPEFAQDISVLDSTPETIGGIQTRRYHIPKEAVDTLVELLGEEFLQDASGLEEFEMTVWLEGESGTLIRAELIATASPALLGEEQTFDLPPDATVNVSMTINLSRFDDPTIEIEPPR